jgi:hypothetical protein
MTSFPNMTFIVNIFFFLSTFFAERFFEGGADDYLDSNFNRRSLVRAPDID